MIADLRNRVDVLSDALSKMTKHGRNMVQQKQNPMSGKGQKTGYQWRIYIVKMWTPRGLNSFIFMQVWKNLANLYVANLHPHPPPPAGLPPQPGGILYTLLDVFFFSQTLLLSLNLSLRQFLKFFILSLLAITDK